MSPRCWKPATATRFCARLRSSPTGCIFSSRSGPPLSAASRERCASPAACRSPVKRRRSAPCGRPGGAGHSPGGDPGVRKVGFSLQSPGLFAPAGAGPPSRRPGLAALCPSPAEVAEVFSVPLSFFRRQQPEVYRYELVPTRPDQFPYGAVGIPETYRWARGTVEVPVWFWEGHPIWGMTARIVRDLIKE